MEFFSPEFFGYFLFVIFLYYLVRDKYQKIIILVSSSLFIGLISVSFLLYTYVFILVNWSLALLAGRNNFKPEAKKIAAYGGIILNICALVFFKYFSWILSLVVQLLNFADIPVSFTMPGIIVPVGISYFTFQGISYLLQVYRGNEEAEKNIIIFSNYFLFFPKFLSGPIELSRKFIPQLKTNCVYDFTNIKEGFKLILWGAFKKMVIADRLSMLVSGVYSDVSEFSGNLLILTFILQPLHIYCDFSGYTDIAVGIGRLFGLRLTDNFNRPFFSTSVTAFWQRWHISLTAWCTEFIYRRIILKRMKWGIWACVYAVFVTFIVVGIWHGPRWNFILLGLFQGIAINYEFFTKKFRLKLATALPEGIVKFGSSALVYIFFSFSLIFFNAAGVSDAMHFIANMFVNIDLTGLNITFLARSDKIILLLGLTILFIIEYRQEQGKNIFDEIVYWPGWLRSGIYLLICILVIYFGSPMQEFIYMQF